MKAAADVHAGDAAALLSIAEAAVARARAAGAEEAEARVDDARAFTVRVSGGEVESIKQSTTRGLGLRVLVNRAVGFVSSNDLREASLDDLAHRAVALARFSTPDDANGLPMPSEAGEAARGDLQVFDPAVRALPPERAIEMAMTLEKVALGVDPRIRRTEGALVGTSDGSAALVSSHGVSRTWSATSIRAYVVPLADDRDGKQQSGSHHVAKRRLADVPDLEWMAREAVRRAVARIGARPVPSARVPVIMHPDISAAWIAEMHEAFTGEAVIKRTSWLADKLGETVASPLVTLVDDGLLPAGSASAAYDGEGVATRRNVLLDRGRCAMFEYDSYHARRAGTRSTGNALRSYASLPGIGPHNLYLEAGAESPEAILARVARGFYMDDQGSYGFDPVTGDYSFQAQGFWIENGVRAFPVDGVTVAGHSLDMLRDVVAVGDDLRFDGSIAAPTILIGEMTVSGS